MGATEAKALIFDEVKVNMEKRIIEGYASTFGNKDRVGDIVVEGAFTKTLNERGKDVPFLYQHDHTQPLGIAKHIEQDSKGLYYQGYVSKTSFGNDKLELARDGVLKNYSIGYDVLQDEYDQETQTRYLKEVRLWEVSLVTFPANPEAVVTGVKSYEQMKQLLQKTAGMDVTRLLKEGRKLSSANEQLIRDAIRALQAVLEIGEPEDDEEELEQDSLKSTHTGTGKPLLYKSSDISIEDLVKIARNYRLS